MDNLTLDKAPPAAQRIAWKRPPGHALDLNGPVSVPYTPSDANQLDQSILELFGRLAERQPDRIAIDDGVLRLTYGEVWAIACRLGRTIAQSSARSGPIAVLLPNTTTYWVGVLGCFAAGHACVLLDRDDLVERTAEIVADARPTALVTDAEGARRHRAWASDFPTVVVEAAFLANAPGDPATTLGPDDPAVIVYTSGSTGRPKGVVHCQRNILYRVMLFVDAAHLNERDRVAVAGAATHAAGLRYSLTVLLSGATLYPVDVRRAGLSGLAGVVRDHEITILQATPSLLRVLMRLEGGRDILSSLRLVQTGGEPLMQGDLRRLRDCLPRECPILYGFNATEGPLAQWFIPHDDVRDPVRVAVGYPPPWCQTAVLDEEGRRCPPGEAGELVLRSRYVALGEWQGGRLLPGRMAPDPDDSAFRIYRTGDLVRQGTDGVIVVIGRKDRQLKIRGQRVEPIEVEGVLRRSPDVLEAVVLPRHHGEDIRLAAFVVPAVGSATKLVDSLRTMLEAALPPYMQPSSIRLLDSLPMLPGGKIDAQALLGRDQAPSAGGSVSKPHPEAAPSTRSQAMVARAWRRILDASSLEQDQRFDQAGGDSLRLLQLVFHLEKQCGAILPLDAFSAALPPSGFARALDRFMAAPADVPSEFPLVFLLPGTSKRDPRLDRFRRACSEAVKMVPIDYGDWFEWVGLGFDFSDLVARVVAQIEAIAPSGPIVLAGYSLGGNVAHLAAQQLIAAGRQVPLVAILATDGRLLPLGPNHVELLTQSPSLQRIRELAATGRRVYARNAIVRTVVGRLIRPRWAPFLRLIARVRPFRWFGDYGFFLNWLLSQVLLHRLSREWRKVSAASKAPMLAPTALFRPRNIDPQAPADLGWGARCPNLTVYDVGGDHNTMLDDPDLSSRLTALVAAAAGGAEGEKAPRSVRAALH